MFDIGYQELLVLAVLAIIIIGPEDLPQFLRKIGKYFRQFKRQVSDIQREVNKAIDTEDIKGLKRELSSIERMDFANSKTKSQAVSGAGASAASLIKDPGAKNEEDSQPRTRTFIPKSEQAKTDSKEQSERVAAQQSINQNENAEEKA